MARQHTILTEYQSQKTSGAPTEQTEREAVNVLNAIADSGMEPSAGAMTVSPDPVKTVAAKGFETAEVPGLMGTEQGRSILNLLTDPQIRAAIDNAGKTGYSNGEPLPLSDVASYLTKVIGGDGGTVPVTEQKNTANEENVLKYFDNKQLKAEPNKAFFWSGRTNGIGGKDYAMGYAAKNGGTTLEGLMESQGIRMPTWDINDPNSIKAWENASAIYASQASGEVRAIIGANNRSNSIWKTIELPRLLSNPEVTKITVIDPESETETIIFRR